MRKIFFAVLSMALLFPLSASIDDMWSQFDRILYNMEYNIERLQAVNAEMGGQLDEALEYNRLLFSKNAELGDMNRLLNRELVNKDRRLAVQAEQLRVRGNIIRVAGIIAGVIIAGKVTGVALVLRGVRIPKILKILL